MRTINTVLTAVCRALSRQMPQVFYMSRIQEYNNQEIAEELNISIRTVETHISNAPKYFKTYFPLFLPGW
ncbi:sigma factor-like helix-turn-helix DNA-binding protein [Sinomicrobium oceani]|uniref:sigma factor-like helix-turn-helix DNA-binding protein n=1 Tax=Sinomicrobium oceani TaxID=1150368 RepID=UPI00227BDAD4|nr:sigma factor-like helix-turn-helix DNA-binding protein [Sinomicrobium oceani]